MLDKQTSDNQTAEFRLSPENIDKILNFVYDGDEEKILSINRLKFRNHISENIKDRYLEVLSYRLIEGLTLEQTGQKMQVTRERVRQVEQKARRQLRSPYTSRKYETITVEDAEELADDLAAATSRVNELEKQNNTLIAVLRRLVGQNPVVKGIIHDPVLTADVLLRGLEELGLSARAWRTLARAGIRTIGDLVDKSDDQLWSIRGMGEKTYSEIKVKLKQYIERNQV